MEEDTSLPEPYYNQNFVTQAHKSQHLNKLTDVKNTSGDKKNCDS